MSDRERIARARIELKYTRERCSTLARQLLELREPWLIRDVDRLRGVLASIDAGLRSLEKGDAA